MITEFSNFGCPRRVSGIGRCDVQSFC